MHGSNPSANVRRNWAQNSTINTTSYTVGLSAGAASKKSAQRTASTPINLNFASRGYAPCAVATRCVRLTPATCASKTLRKSRAPVRGVARLRRHRTDRSRAPRVVDESSPLGHGRDFAPSAIGRACTRAVPQRSCPWSRTGRRSESTTERRGHCGNTRLSRRASPGADFHDSASVVPSPSRDRRPA